MIWNVVDWVKTSMSTAGTPVYLAMIDPNLKGEAAAAQLRTLGAEVVRARQFLADGTCDYAPDATPGGVRLPRFLIIESSTL